MSDSPLIFALRDMRRAFRGVLIFSAALNMLMLAGPLYMLQIYDRVLASRSVETLIALSVMLMLAYLFQATLDLIRARITTRAASALDYHLSAAVHKAVVRLGLSNVHTGSAQQPLRDLDQVRAFLTSGGPLGIADLPWTPVFLLLCFAIHVWLGVTALAGALLLFSLALLAEHATRGPSQVATRQAAFRAGLIETDRRNAETTVAMDMETALAGRWSRTNREYLRAIIVAADVTSAYGALSRTARMILQSGMLGMGAYLVIREELSAGAMIAASIMMGRALAPIETVIANWRGFVAARESLRRLPAALQIGAEEACRTSLPSPKNSLDVQRLSLAAPGMQRLIVRDISFSLRSGEAMGIIGPSGAGKSSLLLGLTGVWQPVRGAVLLDNAALSQWNRSSLSSSIGFLGQTVQLFEGTVASNISRMVPNPDSELVIAAAKAAGTHEMILQLPQGYDTDIGDSGTKLSAGQRQRIGLARALYGDPFLIMLDEPNSNLDADGDAALQNAIEAAKQRGAIVLMIAHRTNSLAVCDKLLVLANGTQQAFGAREEIMQRLFLSRSVAPANSTAPIRVVKPVGASA